MFDLSLIAKQVMKVKYPILSLFFFFFFFFLLIRNAAEMLLLKNLVIGFILNFVSFIIFFEIKLVFVKHIHLQFICIFKATKSVIFCLISQFLI